MKKNIEFTTTIKKNLKDKIDKLNSKGSTHENEEKIKSKLPPNLPREIKTIALKKGLLVNPTQQKASNILTQRNYFKL
jgi:predicted  nucleic acid-binding Zn-ribbon protein